MSEVQQRVIRQKNGVRRSWPASTYEEKKKWITDNWGRIKNCLPDDVFHMMVKEGLYSKKSFFKDSVPVIEGLMNRVRR